MSSSFAAFALLRAIRPMIKLRHFSSLASSRAAPRVLASKTLTTSRILSPSSVPFAFTKAVNAEDKIRRTDADENLLCVLEDKIDEQAPLEAKFPKDFPFKIIDNPDDKSVKLKRKFQGEKIEMLVYKYFDGDADADEEESEQDADEEESEQDADADEEESEQDAAEGQNTDDDCQPHISLIVTIDKAGTALRFWCNLYAEDLEIEILMMKRHKRSDADDFVIERMMMKRPKDSDAQIADDYPEYIDLDEGLQKAFNEYLGARGIKVSLYKGLREYFVHIVRLRYLKEFVEK